MVCRLGGFHTQMSLLGSLGNMMKGCWLHIAAASIHQVMTEVSGLTVRSSEQHVEIGMARRSKDNSDCQKLLELVRKRNPFLCDDEDLYSLSLGLVYDVNDGVNCEKSHCCPYGTWKSDFPSITGTLLYRVSINNSTDNDGRRTRSYLHNLLRKFFNNLRRWHYLR